MQLEKREKQHGLSDRLQDSEALLRAMIENQPGGAAFVVDPDLRYQLAEGEALSAAGFTREDLVGRTIFDILPPELASRSEVQYRKALAGEAFEYEYSAHDRLYISRGRPLRSANGEVYAVLIVSYDVTERKEAEADAAADLEDMQRLRELSTRMVALDDIQTLYQEIVAVAIALTRADAGTVQILDEATQELVLLADQGFEQDIIEHFHRVNASSHTPCGITLATGYRAFVDFNVQESEDPDGSMRLHVEAGYLSAQSTPLITRSGKVIGMVSTHWCKHHRPSDRELRFLDLLARQAADLIEQWLAQVNLRESQARFRSAFSNNMVAMGVWTPTGEITDANDALLYLIGYTRAELEAGSIRWTELTPPEYQEQDEQAVAEVEMNGACTPYEKEFIHQDGYRIPILITGGRFGNRTGKGIFCAFNLRDRKRAEVALRESEEKFRTFVSAASDIIYEMSADWSKMHYLKGKKFITTTENPRHDWTEAYILETDKQQVWAAVNRAIKTHSNFELEHRVIRLDGTVGWTFSRAIPLMNETGEIVKWFGTASDITDRKRAEEAVRNSEIQRIREQAAREEERQRAESLAELDRAKTVFFSNVSHEFRTPLTLSLAPIQDALSDRTHPLPPPQRERLELAQRNTMRLLKLVNTLLDFSRIEADRMEAIYEPTDLAMFTTELASVFRSAIERAGLRLVVDCPPLAEPVYVDREMWEKIVLNLLSNAFKFTFEGEIAVRLHLADERLVLLQVEDTGTGIAPEELPHLFKRFYQVRSTKARTHEGSGIGLALVQELIRLHGGTIDVNSTPGVGSCFAVTILLGTAHLPSNRLQRVVGDCLAATRTLTSTALGAAPFVQEVERWLPQESGGRREASGASGASGAGEVKSKIISANSETRTSSPDSRAYILVVDDNKDMRDYLKRILSEHNEVIAVADGATALAAVNERVPDLVLSDVMMPYLDGFELLKALRASARTLEVPIILLSARAGEESLVQGLQAGADDYLIKPFTATELVTRVLAHLQLAQLRLEALRQERIISRRKDEVLSTVSHELNTPLVAILGWTRLLRSSPPNQPMLAKALETIERNATLQAKLVEDLLDISRITAGKICLNQESIQLLEVIETALATVQQSLQTKDLSLYCQLDSSPVVVLGDRERLQQIILNLLTNAIKFTPNGGRIEISLQTHDHQAQITVTDTGCGIDAEFLPYIFDTFRQAPTAKKGLGLGLAIARNLVELHSGTIAAQSPGVGQGTTFTVKLPFYCP